MHERDGGDMYNGSYEIRKITKTAVRKAVRELARERREFTQYDIHAKIEEWLGRELTAGEKQSITKIARAELNIQGIKRDPDTKVRIYIFIF